MGSLRESPGAPRPAIGTETLAKYFGYMHSKPGGTHDFAVLKKPADAKTLAEFEEVTRVILDLQPLAIALAATERDYRTLAGLADEIQSRLDKIGSADLPMSLVLEILVETTQALGNFLSAASALLGQATRYVSRTYGEESAIGSAWHAQRQQRHADSIGYRLLYELRNFAQHYALPVSAVQVRGELGPGDRMLFSTTARLKRAELLSSGYNWRKRTADIEAQDPEFDVIPLAADYWTCLQDLVGTAASYRASELHDCRGYLAAVRRVTKAPQTARIFLFDYDESPPNGPPSNGAIVPEEQFLWTLQALLGHRLVADPQRTHDR